jgi:hypothetical protein
MPRRLPILLCLPPLLIAILWLRSEFITDLVMRRAPVSVNSTPVDLSRGVVSTRGCILFRRIVISAGSTKRAFWDCTTTAQSQLPETRTAANRLGFGNAGVTITSSNVTMILADSWFPYWLAEIIALVPLLAAIPYVGSALRTTNGSVLTADPPKPK